VGNFLRATRIARRLTQEQVAAKTRRQPWQLSRAAVSAIERGQNFPGMEAMLALSNVLYVDPKELIERARLSTVVPIDITDLTYDELEERASRFFWDGEFKKSLSVYDAMQEKAALEGDDEPASTARRMAVLDVRRATALKRAGALLSAIATAERAIAHSSDMTSVQAEAYVVLADLQSMRGHLPLARDAASRALDLSEEADPRVRGWAFMVQARVLFLSGQYADAKGAFVEARDLTASGGDRTHLTHIAGNIGMCCLELDETVEARRWIEQAVEFARENGQPPLEASWLVELGKLELSRGRHEHADGYAEEALRIAAPTEQHLTIFRAEWLRHKVQAATTPGATDRQRVADLRELFTLLDQHEGIEEVREFKQQMNQLFADEHREEP
jgi:transcriptional regulator with XRE-family HTH domain